MTKEPKNYAVAKMSDRYDFLFMHILQRLSVHILCDPQ